MPHHPEPDFESAIGRAIVPLRPPAAAALGSPAAAPADPYNRAAEYVRMSTDHQRYSTANQRDAIAAYARSHGLEIVRTYADEGRSGLQIKGRDGLQALLTDVVTGRAEFALVLVYDVSRWGRFQDCDESAFYEYLCRRAGIGVEYCMEEFRNDGTPVSAVLKVLKRVMAGQYSRDLSVRVAAAKRRIAIMGYRVGGTAGFGLRRMVAAAGGRPGMVLEDGQHKYLQTDRVVLVPGPPDEQAVVRWMFRQVARRGGKPTPIARALNHRGVPCPGGGPWGHQRVRCMLANEKYIGTLVFSKVSSRLKGPVLRHPPHQWVRVERAFPAVVDPGLFRAAQAAMAGWARRVDRDGALAALRALLARHGRLSTRLIDDAVGMPCSQFYRRRFGTLTRAYALVGYTPRRDGRHYTGYGSRRRQVAALRAEVPRRLRERGVPVRRQSKAVLVVAGDRRVAVMLGRRMASRGAPRWLVQVHIRPVPDWLLVARPNAESTAIDDYCLVPGGSCVLIGVRYRGRKGERYEGSDLDTLLDVMAGWS